MAMIDLKRAKPKKSEKEDAKDVPATAGSPAYDERPYCHRFTLEKPDLEKMGLSPNSFAGMEPIEATVVLDTITIRDVTSKSGNKYDESRDQSVEFQIVKISLGKLTAKKSNGRREIMEGIMKDRGGRR